MHLFRPQGPNLNRQCHHHVFDLAERDMLGNHLKDGFSNVLGIEA
jgi:hypothetical protein